MPCFDKVKRWLWVCVGVFCFLGLALPVFRAVYVSAAVDEETPLRIIYAGDYNGKVKPCG